MSAKRRDSKNRILRTGESQEPDGRYKKLRKGVVERLKALKVSKNYIESFTPDQQLNKTLIDLL